MWQSELQRQMLKTDFRYFFTKNAYEIIKPDLCNRAGHGLLRPLKKSGFGQDLLGAVFCVCPAKCCWTFLLIPNSLSGLLSAPA
jgi:hypothetical protein